MVAADCQDSNGTCRFVIRPNSSLGWRGRWLFFGGISLVCLSIAIAFSIVGFWLILPFAGLELTALGFCLYLVARNSEHCEVITVHGDVVEVDKGREAPEEHWKFQRAWAQVQLHQNPHRWYPSRITLRSHGREVELGAWLNQQEKEYLVTELRRWLRTAPEAA